MPSLWAVIEVHPLKRASKTHKDTDNFVTVGRAPVKHPTITAIW
jgi:hypothetical protein